MKDVTYATKVWKGEFVPALQRHSDANLIIANNLGKRILDIGVTSDYYFQPELAAVWNCTTKYLLWYAGDVEPPETDWLHEAIPLLEHYPIVSCRFDDTRLLEEASLIHALKLTDFGWESYHFSDQCYIAETETMRQIDYNRSHPISEDYPKHGGNSFERRVAQWLAANQTPMAYLGNHRYRHIPKEEKS